MDTARKRRDHAGEVKSMSDMRAETATSPLPTAPPRHERDRDPGPRIRPITVAEYDAMGEAGIFEPGERVELVDGLLIVPPRMGDAHWRGVAWMQHRISVALGERALVTSQLPVIVSDISEPEPDVALVRMPATFRKAVVPRTPDIIAVVEVSDSSLGMDRGRKRRVYARAGIPEYWIVNVRAKQIEIHRDPHGGAYPAPRVAKNGQNVSFAAFPDVVFTVGELLG
jgi:Uma2 family endonuclease